MRDKQETIINGVNVSGCDNPGWILLLPGTGVSYKCDTNCRYACYVYKEQLQRKTAELKKYQDMEKEGPEQYKDVGECWGCGLELTNQQLLKDFKAKTAECEELKESASIAEDNFACEIQARLYHQNEWLKFSKENEELKKSVDKIKNYVKNQMFDVDCENWFDRFIYTFEEWKKSICEDSARYLKALEEIEGIAKGMRSIFIEEVSITASQLNDRIYRETTERFRQILDIISKAKGKK